MCSFAFRWLQCYRRRRHAYWGGHSSRLSSRRCCFFYIEEREQHPPQPKKQQVCSHWCKLADDTKKRENILTHFNDWLFFLIFFYFIWSVSFVCLFFQCSIKKKWLCKDFWKWRWDQKRSEADWKGSYGDRTGTCFTSNTNDTSLFLKGNKSLFLKCALSLTTGEVLSVPPVLAGLGLGIWFLDLLLLLHPEHCLHRSELVAEWLDQRFSRVLQQDIPFLVTRHQGGSVWCSRSGSG